MILMKSETIKVSKILKPTAAMFFKDLKVGGCLQFSVPIAHAGSSRGKTYPTDIEVKNLDTGDSVVRTFNQLANRLESFELVEI